MQGRMSQMIWSGVQRTSMGSLAVLAAMTLAYPGNLAAEEVMVEGEPRPASFGLRALQRDEPQQQTQQADPNAPRQWKLVKKDEPVSAVWVEMRASRGQLVVLEGEKKSRRTWKLADLSKGDQDYAWRRWASELDKHPLQLSVALPLSKPSKVKLPADQQQMYVTVQLLRPKTDTPAGGARTIAAPMHIDGRSRGFLADVNINEFPYERGQKVQVTAVVRAAFEGQEMQEHRYLGEASLPRPNRDGLMQLDKVSLKLQDK